MTLPAYVVYLIERPSDHSCTPAWPPAQIFPSPPLLCRNSSTIQATLIGKPSSMYFDTYLAQRICNLHLEEESTDWRDIQMLTVPHRNTGMPFPAMHSSLTEELSPGAHTSKNLLHYQPLKLNTSLLLTLPKNWLCIFIGEVFSPLTEPTTLHCNNQSAITIATEGNYHAHTKHINIPYHFICFVIDNGSLKLIYCPTNDMTANTLTKALPSPKAKHFAAALGLRTPTSN